MELENIVANTVYIKARAGKWWNDAWNDEMTKGTNRLILLVLKGEASKHKGRSKKWKQLLKLPHISECLYIKNEIELTKEYLIDNQPICKRLFRSFCTQSSLYECYYEFLEAIVSLKQAFLLFSAPSNASLHDFSFQDEFDLAESDKHIDLARNLWDKFLHNTQVRDYLESPIDRIFNIDHLIFFSYSLVTVFHWQPVWRAKSHSNTSSNKLSSKHKKRSFPLLLQVSVSHELCLKKLCDLIDLFYYRLKDNR